MDFVRRHRWLQGLILLGPAAIWATAFIVVPLLMAIRLSFWRMENYALVKEWTTRNYTEFLENSLYHDALLESLKNGATAAVLAVAFSIPLAHFIRFKVTRYRTLLLGAVVVALWLGYLLRIFGWRIMFGTEGILNSALITLGITDHPVGFLVFSDFAVALTQTHLAMPFAFIPIYAAMERLPANLLHAAADLGASRRKQFFRIELSLILPGVIIGATFAFILAFGDYFAPRYVGSPSASSNLANVAASNFTSIVNWPLGAALGVVMMVTVLTLLGLTELVQRLWTRKGRTRPVEPLGEPHEARA